MHGCWYYLFLHVSLIQNSIEVPEPVDGRLVVELIAREPEIVTPTGVAVDDAGRVWAIENHTHQRPMNYGGPAGDRIRIYDDFAEDGRARRVKTFAEGFRNGMGLALNRSGTIYFATRSDISILHDRDGDDVADRQEIIVKLETPGDYPHNGLSGFAFDAFDNVYFGFGENLGERYKLIGSDGTTLSGGGEGGNVYRCRPDGSKLTLVATGFWNPFHLTMDAFDRLFAVDNDPDSRPPCRLLHVVQGGDYGYRFRNGRKGLHPFTAWNGELPGTLPMVAGTGEAPSGIVAYESHGLPQEYRGDLIVTSWGDHAIERFKLRERGASFTAQAETLVRGGENFYPVGIATAPDGSLVVSDWGDKSYPLHGKGRIWRIRMANEGAGDGIHPRDVAALAEPALPKLLAHPSRELRRAAADELAARGKDGMDVLLEIARTHADPRARMEAIWSVAKRSNGSHDTITAIGQRDPLPAVRAESVRIALEHEGKEKLQPSSDTNSASHPYVEMSRLLALTRESQLEVNPSHLESDDPFLAAAAFDAIARLGGTQRLLEYARSGNSRVRTRAVVALRRCELESRQAVIAQFLDDPDADVRRAAVQWVAEENLAELAPKLLDAVMRGPMTRELFEAFMAAQEAMARVTRKPADEISGEEFVARIVRDDSQPAHLRTVALRSLRTDHPSLSTDLLQRLIANNDERLRLESVRTLAGRADSGSQQTLRTIASDSEMGVPVRAEAMVGLARSAAASADTRRLLLTLLHDKSAEIRAESLRSLRAAAGEREVRQAVQAWLESTDVAQDDLESAELLSRAGQNELPTPPSGTAQRRSEFHRVAIEAQVEHGSTPPNAAAGARVFFHPNGPQCSSCHRVNGRGGSVGPDLSAIGRSLDREKIVRSLLEPSKDIAPQYTTWRVATQDGRVHSGILLGEDPRGSITLGDSQGNSIEIKLAEITDRQAQSVSIMPENLIDHMTRQEFRNLVEFLGTLK